jgi:outer membrane biosynthesis protein TonB
LNLEDVVEFGFGNEDEESNDTENKPIIKAEPVSSPKEEEKVEARKPKIEPRERSNSGTKPVVQPAPASVKKAKPEKVTKEERECYLTQLNQKLRPLRLNLP